MAPSTVTARQKSERECKEKLTEIIMISSIKYTDFWDAKGDTNIEVLRGNISEEEMFYVDLVKRDKAHWYVVSGRGDELFNPASTARLINRNLPNASPKELEDTFYASLKGPFGEYLAEKEIAKRMPEK